MKKITLLFFALVAFAWQSNAQFTFPSQAGPYNVAAGTGYTLNLNDAANGAGVTAGNYYSFVVTADWEAGGGGPWSSEAEITVTTAAGAVNIDPPSAGAASSGTATTLTFVGVLAGAYDPSTDGTLDLFFEQSYGGSDANWSNVVVQLITCNPPTVGTLNVVDDCANSQFSIEVPITDLGNSTTLTISNDAGVASTNVTATGTAVAGPFPVGTLVNLTIEHENNADCNLVGGPFTDTCPPSNDECANAIAVACDDTVTGSTAAATDSGNNPSNDVWYSYTNPGVTEDVTVSLCNSGYDTYIRVFDACGGTEIAGNDDSCGTRSEATFTNNGSGTYYIMIEGYNTASGTYELNVTCAANIPPPANDDCASAEALTLGQDANGTTAGATQSAGDQPSCDSFGFIADVWYSFEAPASGEVTIVTTANAAAAVEANVELYDDCAALDANQIAGSCDDDDSADTNEGGQNVSVTGLTAGTTYYLRVWSNGTVPAPQGQRAEGTFTVSVSDTTLGLGDFESQNAFKYYPNPTNDKLHLRAQNNIQNVSVYNMLGQEVLRTAPNAVENDVDMSALQTGAYFVKVTINNITETVRVVKQ